MEQSRRSGVRPTQHSLWGRDRALGTRAGTSGPHSEPGHELAVAHKSLLNVDGGFKCQTSSFYKKIWESIFVTLRLGKEFLDMTPKTKISIKENDKQIHQSYTLLPYERHM